MTTLVHDPSQLHLGKHLGVVEDPRTLAFATYSNRKKLLPACPKTSNVAASMSEFGMLGNDDAGDCTFASNGHRIEGQNKSAGRTVMLNDQQVIHAYSDLTHYNPVTGANDNGAYMLDVANYMRKTGIAGHKIAAFVKLDPSKQEQVRLATWIFEGVWLGVALPISAQYQKTWDVPKGGATGDGEPGSWGGHAIWVPRQSMTSLGLVTWSERKNMTWKFLFEYCDEAYALVSVDQLKGSGKTPQGFNLAALNEDLSAIIHA